MHIEKDELYTINEVAKYLKMHPNSIRRKLRRKDFKAKNVGTNKKPEWRILGQDLLNFINSKK